MVSALRTVETPTAPPMVASVLRIVVTLIVRSSVMASVLRIVAIPTVPPPVVTVAIPIVRSSVMVSVLRIVVTPTVLSRVAQSASPGPKMVRVPSAATVRSRVATSHGPSGVVHRTVPAPRAETAERSCGPARVPRLAVTAMLALSKRR